MMNYYNNIYNGLGKDGEMWNTWGKDVFGGMTELFGQFLTAKYGSATTQQVMNNPTSDYSQQLYQSFLQSQQNQQATTSSSSDKTLLYVAIAGLGIMALMMLNNNNNRK